jgi:nitrate reductase gamma subunit
VTRYVTEILIFRTLFADEKALWAASWLFHVALAFVLGGHVTGILFLENICELRGWTPGEYESLSAISGGILGIIILIPLLYLFVRRMREERVRYVSNFGDYFALLLLLGIVITGDLMRFNWWLYSGPFWQLVGFPIREVATIHLVDVHKYVMGLITLRWVPAPRGTAFVWHFFFVNLLLMYAPFGKLVHAGGIFFSPTRNQRNNSRDQRHINPWNELDSAQEPLAK